jgi:hypothetical protein
MAKGRKPKEKNRALVMAKLAENPPPVVELGDKLELRWDTYHYEVTIIKADHVVVSASVLPAPYNIAKALQYSHEDLRYLTWRIEKSNGTVWEIPELHFIE